MLEAVDPWGDPVILTSSMCVMSQVYINTVPATTDDVLAAVVFQNNVPILRGKANIQVNNGIAGCLIQIYTETNGEEVFFKVWDESAQQAMDVNLTMFTIMDGIIGTWPSNLYQINAGDVMVNDPWLEPNILPSSMTIMSQVLLNNVPTEQGDVLAAFVFVNGQEQLRGKAVIQVNNGISGCLIQIYAETGGQNIYFRLWDYSTQSICTGSMPLTTIVNGEIGSWPDDLYIINIGGEVNTVSNPVFSPVSGTYPVPLSVSISCATPGASIHYTTDGSIPVFTSTEYTEPFLIYDSCLIRAKAYLAGYNSSPISITEYSIQMHVPQPYFSPAGGEYSEPQLVTITCPDPMAIIRYTTNGVTPSEQSFIYSEPLLISVSTTLICIAYRPNWAPSLPVTAVYNIASANPPEEGVTPLNGIQNIYPNPFSQQLNIEIGVSEKRQDYRLSVYNIKGELVHRTAGSASGNVKLTWNGIDGKGNKLPAGIYLISLQTDNLSETRKVILK